MIERPDLEYNDKKHEYRLNGEKLLGVSTVAKVGDTDVWGVAAAWAFRIGYEGATELVPRMMRDGGDGSGEVDIPTKDEVREALKQARKTPWHKTDSAKGRGNSIHAALESLAQKNMVPILSNYPESEHGYIKALCKWYGDYRPKFEATEVQVVSENHLFAGRYDMRCRVQKLLLNDETTSEDEYEALLLVDLKTGKYVYPTTQFPQLAGYELAGVEMGYAPTDGQYILNVHEDGSYEFARSCATAEHFLAYLSAQRAIIDLKEKTKKGRK